MLVLNGADLSVYSPGASKLRELVYWVDGGRIQPPKDAGILI